jgi:hypothetical protein
VAKETMVQAVKWNLSMIKYHPCLTNSLSSPE